MLFFFFYKQHSQLIKDPLKHLLFFAVQVTTGFFFKHAQDINGLFSQGQVFIFRTASRIINDTQADQGRCIGGQSAGST